MCTDPELNNIKADVKHLAQVCYMSSSTSVSLVAVAVLENGQQVGNSKHIIFDTHLYLPGGNSALAALFYFNEHNIIFEPIGRYFLHALVSCNTLNIWNPTDSKS